MSDSRRSHSAILRSLETTFHVRFLPTRQIRSLTPVYASRASVVNHRA